MTEIESRVVGCSVATLVEAACPECGGKAVERALDAPSKPRCA